MIMHSIHCEGHLCGRQDNSVIEFRAADEFLVGLLPRCLTSAATIQQGCNLAALHAAASEGDRP